MACQHLGGITLATLYRMLRRGDLKGHKAGNRILFEQGDLDDYIERRRVRPRALASPPPRE
jgi:excisionase family DNA binding protein